jgi:rRNA maturation RNase YbeY
MRIIYESDYENEKKIDLENPNYSESIFSVIHGENIHCSNVTVIWVSDEALLGMHVQYLDDPTYTDIMTFNLGDEDEIDAELYVSVDRAIDHAEKFSVSVENELSRLLIHGMLHLAGYDDHEEEDYKLMKIKEEKYLNKIF